MFVEFGYLFCCCYLFSCFSYVIFLHLGVYIISKVRFTKASMSSSAQWTLHMNNNSVMYMAQVSGGDKNGTISVLVFRLM